MHLLAINNTDGEDTGNPACTHAELTYWKTKMARLHPNCLLPINMLKHDETEHDHIDAELLFTNNIAYETWPLDTSMPKGLVEKIARMIREKTSGQSSKLVEM